jgi:hypothetical protein
MVEENLNREKKPDMERERKTGGIQDREKVDKEKSTSFASEKEPEEE